MLVVFWQYRKVKPLEGQGASGIVKHRVEGDAVAHMCILGTPMQLYVVEDARGDHEAILHDAVKLTGSDAARRKYY